MNEISLESKIEAVLFYKSEPIAKKKLAEILAADDFAIEEALQELERKLEGRGVQLVLNDDEVMLGTAPGTSEIIEKLQKEEMSRDLGKAGLETLAIVLYKGPVTRREIDYIRGVNSSFIVRNLLVRGLVLRMEGGAEGKRGYLYKASVDLLTFMGLSKIEDLPEFETFKTEMKNFAETEQKETENDAK